MDTPKKKPSLLTPELVEYIERHHVRQAERAAAKSAESSALREAWATEGGRAFRRFIDTRPAATTQRIYTQHLTDFLLWLAKHAGGIDLLDATPEDLARYERDVADRVSIVKGRRLSLRTRQDRVRTVRTAYQFCVDEGLIDRSPARHVRIRGRAEPKRTFLSEDGVVVLLRACEGDKLVDLRDRSLVTFLLHTGLRAAEAASLTWGALGEPPNATVTVEGKGRVVRTIPVSETAIAELRAWARVANPKRRPDDRIWTRLEHRMVGAARRGSDASEWTLTERPISSDTVHSIVTKRAAKGRLENVTPHTLRRTYASKIKRMGVALDTIQRYLGHASILTTASYFDPRDEDAVNTVRQLSYGSSTPR